MAAALVLVVTGVANVLAQASYGASGFTYKGCSSVDLSCFGIPVVFPDGAVTPEACQAAYQGHQFAALFPDGCRCGDDASVINKVDESICDHPCMGNPALGSCVSDCPDKGAGIANVYERSDSPGQAPEPVTLRTIPTVSAPAPAPDTSCSTSGQVPSAVPPAVTLITPFGHAPEAPTSFPPRSPEGPAPEPPSLPPHSPDGPAPPVPSPSSPAGGVPTPCTERGSMFEMSTQPPQPWPSEESSEPPAYGTTDGPSPYTTEDPSPPECPQGGQTAPPSEACANPDTPDGGCEQNPNKGINCTDSVEIQLSPHPSESTLWPSPLDPVGPKGQPPVPSQVPGSDSTHSLIPPLSTIGGLALLAAMIM